MAPHYINKLQGRQVLIVGGSAGIGFAVAEAALEHGADVTISSSNQENIDRAVRRLQSHIQETGLPQRKVSGKVCDLADTRTMEDNVKSLLDFASRDGKLDHVVFTAGDHDKPPALSSVTFEEISKVTTVRTWGGLMLAKYLLEYMNQTDNSSFTVTSSTTDWRPVRMGWSVLKGANGGIEAMARGLAYDLKPVRVNCVSPGFVRTGLFDKFPKEALGAIFAAMETESIMGKLGSTEELAEAYMYLMKNTFATGSTIVVDGGRLVGRLAERT